MTVYTVLSVILNSIQTNWYYVTVYTVLSVILNSIQTNWYYVTVYTVLSVILNSIQTNWYYVTVYTVLSVILTQYKLTSSSSVSCCICVSPVRSSRNVGSLKTRSKNRKLSFL